MSHTQDAPPIVAASDLSPLRHTRNSVLDQVCEHIVDAGLAGARWVVLPEGCIPGYPAWVWTLPPGDHPLLDSLRAEARAQIVRIPSDITDRLCGAALRAQVNVAIGVIECEGGDDATCYNTLLFINSQGRIIGRYHAPCLSTVTRLEWMPAAIRRPADETPANSRVGGI